MNEQIEKIKIASVTMVKNESDIIELFVRFNLKYIDEMYIIDHQSNDETLDILGKLKDEGLPIHLYKYNSYAYDQGILISTLVNKIKDEGNIDYVITFDADEYIMCESKEVFIDELIQSKESSYHFNCYDYMISYELLDKDLYSHEKMIFKPIWPGNLLKSLINVKLYKDRYITVREGLHNFGYNGQPIGDIKRLEKSYLAHLKYRDNNQLHSKIIIGVLSYMIRNEGVGKGAVFGVHWFNPYHQLIHKDQPQPFRIPTPLPSQINAKVYNIDPIKFSGELKYTKKNNLNALENILDFFKSYIEYNDDIEKMSPIIELLDCVDKNNKEKTIISVTRACEKYIIDKGLQVFNVENLEELE